jgi:hypothetical protein
LKRNEQQHSFTINYLCNYVTRWINRWRKP